MAIGDERGGIALVGYRATGKSTVGRLLAGRLGWPFVDADAEVERRAGRPIAAVFAERGEPAFRELEQETLVELTSTRRPLVLATGGGAVLREPNRLALRRFGLVVWLAAGPESIVDRLRADPDGRPALTPMGLLDEVAELLSRREPHYRQVADLVVPTDGLSAEQVADAVLAHLDPRDPGRPRIAPDHPRGSP